MLPLPPLNALRAFEVAGRLRSITRAAEELHVTPAAVSRQIKALEDFLGVQLFDRGGGRFALTPVGERYLASVAVSLNDLRAATNAAMGGTYRRLVLRLRSPATFAVKWLIPRLAGFHSKHPTIDVQLATSPAPLDFEREDIDAGVELGDGTWPRDHTIRLVPNELVPVMSRDAAFAPPTRPDDLSHCTLLHSLARPDDWSLWLEAAGAANVNPYSGMKYETSLLAYQAASEGHGVAVAQKAFVEKELASGGLFIPIDFVLDRGRHTYYFVWPEGREPSAPLAAFIAWLRQASEARTASTLSRL
ncbi:transcriptional regulator GcvA [Variovorax defluvii]|uniref:Transcriptional regulator GcvA n=1 Tax=Variovorax defluvii TaxID=913761 RepID=A0ABP8HU74_9BURK